MPFEKDHLNCVQVVNNNIRPIRHAPQGNYLAAPMKMDRYIVSLGQILDEPIEVHDNFIDRVYLTGLIVVNDVYNLIRSIFIFIELRS